MKVLVYVEGPADRAALDKLLDPIVSEGRSQGVGIRLVPLNGKSHVLNDSPRKAADHLAEHPDDWVFALPDPPKRVIEALFEKYQGRKYIDTTDAAWILGRASLDAVVAACPQRFALFVAELRQIVRVRSLP
jgi:hypothetical protein